MISFISDFFNKLIVISLKRDFNKDRQVIIKLKSSNNNEENGEKINEEVVFITSAINYNNSLSITLIPGFL